MYGQKTSAYRVYGEISKVKKIINTEWAYAALKTDGSVITWGQPEPTSVIVKPEDVAEELKSDVIELFSSKNAFAALKKDGSVVTWGGDAGGDSSSVKGRLLNVKKIIGAYQGMIALTHDNKVVLWGRYNGREPVSDNVKDIYATNNDTYIALLDDDSAVAFGQTSKNHSSKVKSVVTNAYAYAILNDDGSVECGGFGSGSYGAKCDTFDQLKGGVVEIISSPALYAFVARLSDGSAFTWGNTSYSVPNIKSVIPTISSIGYGDGLITYIDTDDNVTIRGGLRVDKYPPSKLTDKSIYANLGAFASTDLSGNITTWGFNRAGAKYSLNLSNIVDIKGADSAFIALDKDGNASEWGGSFDNGFTEAPEHSTYIKGNLFDIESIHGASKGFSVVKKNGAILSWGTSGWGNSANPTIEDREKLLNMRNQLLPLTDTVVTK